MKKLLTLLLIVTFTASLSAVASAYKMVDGDIIDYWAQMDEYEGDSLVETADGVRITFGRPMWAIRVGTIDTFKLDGLTIQLKDVEVSAANALAIGISNTEGGWVDSRGIFFLHFTTSVSETLGDAPNGWMLAKQGLDLSDLQPRVIPDTLNTKKPEGNFTVSFKKNADGSWTYTFNGQQFLIPKESMDAHIKDQTDVYVSFGNWGMARGTIAYTVADITGGTTASSSSSASSSAVQSSSAVSSGAASSSTTVSTSEALSIASSLQSSEESSEAASTESEDLSAAESSAASSEAEEPAGSKTGTIIVIIVIAVALAGAVTAGVLLVKKGKKS